MAQENPKARVNFPYEVFVAVPVQVNATVIRMRSVDVSWLGVCFYSNFNKCIYSF